MMTLRIKVIILVFLFLGLVSLVRLIKKRRLELAYALTWMILDVGLFLIVIIPGFINWIANVLGIYDVTNMVFFLGFIFAIILIFNLTMSMSRQSNKMRQLAQAVALDNYENRVKKNESETND